MLTVNSLPVYHTWRSTMRTVTTFLILSTRQPSSMIFRKYSDCSRLLKGIFFLVVRSVTALEGLLSVCLCVCPRVELAQGGRWHNSHTQVARQLSASTWRLGTSLFFCNGVANCTSMHTASISVSVL